MLRILFFLISITVLVSCKNADSTKKIFKPESLPSQTFTIDTGKDTLLRTQRGAVIKIPKGALQSSKSTVQLEIKEAYHISEMISAGLTTQSNGQLLSSGGMIYINAVDEGSVKIAQPLQVSIPSNYINNDMQLFKGEADANGNMNWTNPTALNNVQLQSLNAGRILYESKCTSCHGSSVTGKPQLNTVANYQESLYQYAGNNQQSDSSIILGDMTGPSLAHISKKRDRQWLYKATRNFRQLVASGDQLAACIYEQWNKTAMNTFPELTDKDLDMIYDYIEHISDSARLPLPADNTKACIDSCRTYNSLRKVLSNKRDSLITGNEGQVREERNPDTTPTVQFDSTNMPAFPDPPTIVLNPINPVVNEGLFYQFNIESFGWFNVDIVLKDGEGMLASNLMVRIQGEYRGRINVYLVIPSIRCLAPAGKVADEKDEYVFAERDGRIFLPENAKGYIIAMGDKEDDISLAKTEFRVQATNSFTLTPKLVSRAEFNRQMAQLNFEQLNITVRDSKNVAELRKTIRDLKEAEKLKPKNCNCGCGALKDTISSEMLFY
jgi:cytochrome c5